MTITAPARRSAISGNWAWFTAWALVGAAYGLAALGALTIGIFVLPIAVAGTIVLLLRPATRTGALGLISGAGVPVLWVALLNRSGPGTICTADGSSCVEQYNPWTWLTIGAALLAVGIAAHYLTRRRSA